MKQYVFKVNGEIHTIRATKLHTALSRLGDFLEAQDTDLILLKKRLNIQLLVCRTVQPKCEHIHHLENVMRLGQKQGTTLMGKIFSISTYGRLDWTKVRLCPVCRSSEEQRRQELEQQVRGQQQLVKKD